VEGANHQLNAQQQQQELHQHWRGETGEKGTHAVVLAFDRSHRIMDDTGRVSRACLLDSGMEANTHAVTSCCQAYTQRNRSLRSAKQYCRCSLSHCSLRATPSPHSSASHVAMSFSRQRVSSCMRRTLQWRTNHLLTSRTDPPSHRPQWASFQ